jgi:hypothetical protein
VQRQPWPLVLCGPHRRPRLLATFAMGLATPRKFMIATAASTTSQVVPNISSACMELRLRPDRPAHRHPRHPPNPSARCYGPRLLPPKRRRPRERTSANRSHHLIKTFWHWQDRQLPDGTGIRLGYP